MELFDQYFKRADLDRDGRISGAEAVAFFQGSSLPKQVLAQIWMHADQNRTGFLGRPEFYNALKLVTVAQSGRELTPDIVKAALFGPAAAKIPAPKIDTAPIPAAVMGSMVTPRPHLGSAVPPSTQMGVVAPTSQNFRFSGPQVPPNVGMNQQVPSSFNSNFMRPPQTALAGAVPPMQGVSQGLSTVGNMAGPRFPGMNTPNLSTDWLGSRNNGASAGGASLSGTAPPKPQSPILSSTTVSSKPLDPALSSFQPSANDSKALVLSGNGFSSDSVFGGDTFSVTQAKPGALTSTFSAGSSMTNASNAAPAPAGSQNSVKPAQSDPFQNILALPHGGSQLHQSHSVVKQNQLDLTPSSSSSSVSNISVGAVSSVPGQAQLQWPKITQSDIIKYTKVFVEVDKDRDGKITGEEARNLFLSWRLPREVLKQVWDLSDQDNDSMLSLREFCIALYLMERYREGRPLPAVLPNNLRFDETLLQATGQPPTAHGSPSWKMSPGLPQQGIAGSRPVMPTSGPRPPMHNSVGSLPDGALQQSQNMSRVPTSERNLQNQHNNEEHYTQVVTDENNKVEEMKILDSREKIEFYRTKMQELVLYKSRCDNRLNEISERASADKREVESLAKKHEEKYKQVADVASKLTVEEANFRYVQERKVELQNAIVKMEQGGSVDGLLQVRADRIQADLEELAKALSERSKQRGIDVKTSASVELPFGWQPGIQEGAVDWDEEWDKFEDEGFSIAKDFSSGVENGAPPANDSPSLWGDEIFTDEVSAVESSSHYSNAGDHITENGSADAQSEDGSTRSPLGSPGIAAFDSRREFHSPLHDASPHAKDSYSDHGGAESTFSGDKFGDESSWGANFDTNDDIDSVWGFNTKDTGQSSFFDSGDFGLNPIKVDSPTASNEFGKDKRSSFFADSVPSSPLLNCTSPMSFNDRPDNRSFDASSRFDSFSMGDSDSGLFQQRETLARFDSIRSTNEFGHSRDFSVDDGDPFGSSGPFKSTETNYPRKKGSDNWSAF